MVTVFMGLLPVCLLEFFASLAEAHTRLLLWVLGNLNGSLEFFVGVARGFRGCSF